MTFWKYITRPSGFGRTEWGAWGTALAIGVYGAMLVFIDFDPVVASVVGICFLLTLLIFCIGTYKNFREDQRDLSNPNNHMDDVWYEGKEFPTLKKPEGAPITDPVLWIRARYEVSEDEAYSRWNGPDQIRYSNEHHAYLKDERFDKFLRK